MPDPTDMLEEAKDLIDEITDLDSPVPILKELAAYLTTVTDVCEALGEADQEKTP